MTDVQFRSLFKCPIFHYPLMYSIVNAHARCVSDRGEGEMSQSPMKDELLLCQISHPQGWLSAGILQETPPLQIK